MNTITLSNDTELLKNILREKGTLDQVLINLTNMRKGYYTICFAEYRQDEYLFHAYNDYYSIKDVQEWCILVD